MDKLTAYLKEIFGVQLALKVISDKKLSSLPYYLKAGYELFEGMINDVPVIFAKLNNEKTTTPSLLTKQGEILEKQLQMNVVFVFDKLEAYERKRFIEKKIAFLEPFKQIYIPSLLLELNNISKRKTEYEIKSDKLTVPAQVAILFHLQEKSLNNKPLQEIAELLKYSRMTVTRIIRELGAFGFCDIKGEKRGLLSLKNRGNCFGIKFITN